MGIAGVCTGVASFNGHLLIGTFETGFTLSGLLIYLLMCVRVQPGVAPPYSRAWAAKLGIPAGAVLPKYVYANEAEWHAEILGRMKVLCPEVPTRLFNGGAIYAPEESRAVVPHLDGVISAQVKIVRTIV